MGMVLPEAEFIGETELKYVIDTELSIGSLGFLPDFLRRQYLLRYENYTAFRNIRIITERQKTIFSFGVYVPNTNQYVDVTVYPDIPIGVTMKISDPDISKSYLR